MTFYEIEMLSVPKIIFACDVETAHYKNSFLHKKDFLEISCIHSGMLLEHTDGRNEIAYPKTVTVITSDLCCHTTSYGEQLQRHTTVGVKLKYHLTKHSEKEYDIAALQERVQGGNVILLPHLHPMEDAFEKTLHLIRAVILSRGVGNEASSLYALSSWYALTAFLTDYVIQTLSRNAAPLPPSEYAYATQASQYITLHLSQKMTVAEIAEHLGISQGYLHRIFRNTKGCGVTAYINHRRVDTAKELIQNKNISLSEAAKNVGIEDVAYMSRLFKKESGISFRKYYQTKETGKD